MDRKSKHRCLNTVIWIILLLGNMEQVDGGISISPSVPVMGGPGVVVFTCNTSGFQGKSIVSIHLRRKRAVETEFSLMATISNLNSTIGSYVRNVPFHDSGSDLITRAGISLSGSIQTYHAQVSSLQLDIQQVNLLCTDEAEYQCAVTHHTHQRLDQSITNLTIFVPPKDLTLTVTHNGTEPGGGLHTHPTQFSVGDVIQFTCSGSIGSNRNQEFQWLRMHRTGFVEFSPYNPDPADENKGTVPATPVNCMYNRTATLSYTISQEDGNRHTVLGFKCEAEYGTQTQDSLPYYITVPGGSTMTTPTDSTASCVSEVDRLKTTAILIGVVGAVIIVGLIAAVLVFLLTRRNTSGQENGNTRGTELSQTTRTSANGQLLTTM